MDGQHKAAAGPGGLDAWFSRPLAAACMAALCNLLWGSAFPFIKWGYRLFSIDAADVPSILVFAGARFMVSGVLVYVLGSVLRRRPLPLPRAGALAMCCGLGLWQTAAQYAFFYVAVAMLTGAMGGILNSSASFIGVILAHFLYGRDDRLTVRKVLGCAVGFGGVVVAALGDTGGGSAAGVVCILCSACIFASSGPLNKAVTRRVDSFSACVVNLLFGGFVLVVLGAALGGRMRPQSLLGVPVLLYLAFVSGAGYVLWALLMKNNPVSRISVYGLLIPVTSTVLSAVINGETLFSWNIPAALAMVCAGIWLVNRPAVRSAV